jgi:hypothetical protein
MVPDGRAYFVALPNAARETLSRDILSPDENLAPVFFAES